MAKRNRGCSQELSESYVLLVLYNQLQGVEITFAVNEDHNVYVFGSMGIGPTGNTEKIPEDNIPDLKYNSPVRVEYLKVSQGGHVDGHFFLLHFYVSMNDREKM